MACEDCGYRRAYNGNAALTADTRAAVHMVQRRHSVVVWRTDAPNRWTRHAPNLQPVLDDLPPF